MSSPEKSEKSQHSCEKENSNNDEQSSTNSVKQRKQKKQETDQQSEHSEQPPQPQQQDPPKKKRTRNNRLERMTSNVDGDEKKVSTTMHQKMGATTKIRSLRIAQASPKKKMILRQKRIGNMPPLHWACERGDAGKVRRLLARDGDDASSNSSSVNVSTHDPEDDGNTPLHVAARAGHVDVASVLLEFGAKIESRNKYGDTCLHTASANGQIRLVRFFLDRDIKIEMQGRQKGTALHSAAENGQPATCKFLILEGGANVEARTARGDTPLHAASFTGETGAMKMLLRMGADIEARNKMFETPLHRACASGQTEAVRLLILRKADLEVRQKFGWTLAHTASSNGHTETVKLLLEFRADINAQDYNGNTPLHVASFFGKGEVVKFLLSKNCELEVKDTHGRTALHHGAWCGQRVKNGKDDMPDYSTLPIWYGFTRTGEAICSSWQSKSNPVGVYCFSAEEVGPSNHNVVRTLLGARASVLAKDFHNHTPVHFAVCTGQLEACKLIMKSGARLGERGEYGRTVLHLIACGCGQIDVGNLMLDRNVPVEAREKNGDTALSLACRFGKIDFAMLLIQKGANANGTNRNGGDAPLHRAAEFGHVDITKMLLSLKIDGQRVVDVDTLNGAGDSALVRAASCGQVGVTWLLLSSGASIEFQRSEANKKRTALHVASEQGHLDVVRLLLDNKADVAMADSEGKTALHLAAGGGHVDICRMLIKDYSANPEASDIAGCLPIHCAAQNGKPEVVEMFLTETEAICADVRDGAGNTPLHYVCDRFKMSDDDIKVIRLFADDCVTNTPIGKLMRIRNNEGEIPYNRLRNVYTKTKEYDELMRFISSKM